MLNTHDIHILIIYIIISAVLKNYGMRITIKLSWTVYRIA